MQSALPRYTLTLYFSTYFMHFVLTCVVFTCLFFFCFAPTTATTTSATKRWHVSHLQDINQWTAVFVVCFFNLDQIKTNFVSFGQKFTPTWQTLLLQLWLHCQEQQWAFSAAGGDTGGNRIKLFVKAHSEASHFMAQSRNHHKSPFIRCLTKAICSCWYTLQPSHWQKPSLSDRWSSHPSAGGSVAISLTRSASSPSTSWSPWLT